jgi:hypothetical protein
MRVMRLSFMVILKYMDRDRDIRIRIRRHQRREHQKYEGGIMVNAKDPVMRSIHQ